MQTIIVDMTPGFRMPTIYYSQGDIGTQFAVDLRSRFGDSLPAGATVTIQATKPSGFGFSETATSVTNGVAVFTTVAGMTDEAGRFAAELKVEASGITLFTANFYMNGEASAHPEGTIDGSEETVIPELTQLVERAEEAASSVLDRQTVTNTLPAGSQASYTFDEETNTQTFGIPQGEAGAGAAGVTASAYSSSRTYAVGDYVIHNSNLYRCTTAITTAEAFTAAHWTQVVLADDVTDLKSDIRNITGNQSYSFTEKTCIANSGSTTTLEQVSYNTADSAIIPCSEGDVFTISGEGLFNYRLWAFVGAENNSSYPVLSKAGANAVANGLFITAPANTAYLSVNAKRSPDNYVGLVIFGKTVEKRLDALEPQIATIENDVDALADNIVISTSTLIAKNPDSTEANTVYSTMAPNGTTLIDYQTDDFIVNGGERYDITVLNLPSAPQYKVAMFYDANNVYIGYREREGGTQAQNNVFTTVPANAKTMRISRSIYSTLSVKKYVPNNNNSKKRVSLNSGAITIDCNEFKFLLNKHGNNNLMDFRSVSDKNNNLIYQATSDWQGPYEVQAINNADGDAISYGMAYTGGNHAYNPENGGLSGTATARTTEYHVYADGVELNDGDDIAWADCVKVSWINYVQGWNTKKSDGTGREILKENPTWVFYPNGKIVVSNTIIALEDVKVDMYYGLQMQSAWADGGVFIPSATRERTAMSIFNAEGLGTKFSGNQTITYDSDVVIKMGFNPDVDLGNGDAINNASIKETRVHATSGAGKLYIYMGVDYSLNEDEQMVYEGYYQFYKPSE